MLERAEEIYQALLNAGLSEKEIKKQLNEKESEFQGFITKSAILYLIAKEHGVNVDSNEDREIMKHITENIIDYNDFMIPISSIIENLRNIVIAGRVKKIFQIKHFIRKDSTTGSVGSFQICDDSQCIKIVLWDDMVSIMENDLFKNDVIIQLIGGYSKKGRDGRLEVHLSRQGKIILAPEDIVLPNIIKYEIKEIKNFENPNKFKKEKIDNKVGGTIQSLHNKKGFVRFISGKVKIEFFKELTLKSGAKSFLLKFILFDELSSIKTNIWGLKAVECVKLINDGDKVKLSNVVIKKNLYTNEKELNFTNKSYFEVL